MEKLNSYLFHFNPWQGLWYCFRREDYNAYMNDDNNSFKSSTRVVKHANIGDLTTFILKESVAGRDVIESEETESHITHDSN